ncbi:hypothetical protein ACFLSZ_06600 [Candidatus Bipolaricaulota bacterium]
MIQIGMRRLTSMLLMGWIIGWGCGTQAALAEESGAIPWGAMYTPNHCLIDSGMTGSVKHYRGTQGAVTLLEDLALAEELGVFLILTLGNVSAADYLDVRDAIDSEIVERELDPFFAISESIRPYVLSGTIWGIRFLDEPHDPRGYPASFDVDPIQLGAVYARIREAFGDVPVGSTAPPWYMIQVPNAGLAFGQIVHNKLPPGYDDAMPFFREQSALAHANGLLFVASVNANTNSVDNATFFQTYREMCAIPTVDFATAWQWPQGHHPMPSFETRLNDPDPAVQAEIEGIPEACLR